jgi:hypothetical protein
MKRLGEDGAGYTNSEDARGDSQKESPLFLSAGTLEAVEWWFGIGGPMVVGSARQAMFGTSRGTGAQQKKAVGRGTAKMRAAADKALQDNCKKIANSLLAGIRKGNSNSAKLLFALAEGHIDLEGEETVQQLCSLAEQLAAEEQWEEPATEGSEARVKQGEPMNEGTAKK